VSERLARTSPLPLLALLFAGLAVYGARGSLANFLLPWEATFGSDRAGASLVVTAGFLSLGAGQVVGGKVLERVAAWRVLAVGLALATVGYTLGALAPSLWLAVLLVGVVGGFGGGLAANSTLLVLVSQLYRERHGALFGLVGAATAAGSVVMLPATRLALDASLEAAIMLLAVCIGLSLVGCLLFLRASGTRPTRATSPVGARQLARRREFWYLAIPFFVCGVTSTGITDTHLVAYMEGCHIGGGTASALVGMLALFNLAGTFASGLLTDRYDPRILLAIVYTSRGIILLLLPLLQTTELLALFSVGFGLADFSTVPPTTALAKTQFATGGWALVLGLIGAAHQVGSALGGAAGGVLYDATGGYGAFFVAAAATCGAAAVLSLLIGRKPGAPERAAPRATSRPVAGAA
jgi:predicted MFS family arabinose efflux permease